MNDAMVSEVANIMKRKKRAAYPEYLPAGTEIKQAEEIFSGR